MEVECHGTEGLAGVLFVSIELKEQACVRCVWYFIWCLYCASGTFVILCSILYLCFNLSLFLSLFRCLALLSLQFLQYQASTEIYNCAGK